MRVRCNNYGLGTWFQLSRLCSVMQFPEHFMIFPDMVHMLVRESLCRTLLRIQDPKLVFTWRQFQERLKAMGPFRWAWAQGPYGSWNLGAPPWFIPGCREELKSWPSFLISEILWPGTRGYGFSLMLISKDMPFRGVRYSCHYCLTVREPKRRMYRLPLVFAGPFVNRAHLLLD